nr:gamma carbonic anhydrase family protein [Pyrinomonadaceae bacterium]
MIRPFQGKHPQVHETAYIEASAQVIGDVVIGEES